MRPLCLVALAWCAPKCAIQLHHDDGSDMLAIATRRRNARSVQDFAGGLDTDMFGFRLHGQAGDLLCRPWHRVNQDRARQINNLRLVLLNEAAELRVLLPCVDCLLCHTKLLGDTRPRLTARAQHRRCAMTGSQSLWYCRHICHHPPTPRNTLHLLLVSLTLADLLSKLVEKFFLKGVALAGCRMPY